MAEPASLPPLAARPARLVICTGPLEDPQSEQYWMLASALAQAGHQPTLVIHGQNSAPAGPWEGCDVRLWPRHPLYGWRNAAFFWRLLADTKPHAVIASLRPNNIAIPLSYLRRVPGRIAWHRNHSSQQEYDHPRPRAWQHLRNRGKGVVFRMATRVVPVSEAGRRDAIEAYGVPPPQCTAVFPTCRPDPRRHLALPEMVEQPSAGPATKRIVNLGRVVHSKGIDLLLRAMRQICDRNPDWKLELVQIGKGPQQAELLDLARSLGLAGQVRFLGHLPQARAFPQVVAADVLALPFRSDPGPGVIPEGLGLGVPIVASAVGGIGELFHANDAVRLVPPEDAAALAGALQDVLADPALAGRMARAGRQLYEEKYRLDYWVRDVRAWLESTVLPPALATRP